MIQLSSNDAMMLHMERPQAFMNGGIVLVYDRTTAPGGVFEFQDVRRHIQERLHLMDPFRMKLVKVPGHLDRPYWVEDQDFDLDYHLRNVMLPGPGDWRQFCGEVALAIERPLDMLRPPWELEMIDGLDGIDHFPKGAFALILRVHHAALDGKAYLAIMQTLHSRDPQAQAPALPSVNGAIEAEPSSRDLVVRAGVHAAQMPLVAARALVPNGLALIRALPAVRRLRRGGRGLLAPHTRFSGAVSPHRVWGACFFDVADTKPIRKAVEGATVGDIAMSVYGAALRAYLDGAGELPAESLRGFVLVAVPSPDGRVLGNHFSGMVISLGTDLDDPLERLAAVRAQTRAVKQARDWRVGRRNVADLIGVVPDSAGASLFRLATLASLRLGRGVGGVMNTAVTGMAGPKDTYYLGGAQLSHLMGLGPPVDGMGLINMYGSYRAEFTMFFAACRRVMPNPGRYEACIYEAFGELQKAAKPKSSI